MQVHFLSSNEQIDAAASVNLQHALHYALLCLPEKFSEIDLFMVRRDEQRCPHMSADQHHLPMCSVLAEDRRHLVPGRLPHDVR